MFLARFLAGASSAGVLVALVGPSLASEVGIVEQEVAPAFAAGMTYTLSPRGMHVATAHGRDGKTFVTVDGVEGQAIDSLFLAAFGVVVEDTGDGSMLRAERKWTGPVAFSPDGTRHAYAGQIGAEAVVFVDGEEVHRGPVSARGAAIEQLQFSPDGQHVFFLARTEDSYQSFRLVRDGEPVSPVLEGPAAPFFDADGSRWGLVATAAGAPPRGLLVVDGEEQVPPGDRARFTPDGKGLMYVVGAIPQETLLVDGREQVTAHQITKVVVSSTGDVGVIATVDANGRKRLFVNGEPVLDDATDIVFSPDGRRRAVVCALNQKAWVVLDGEKHDEFWPIERLAFTPDSSKCVYVGKRDGLTHVVVNGVADAGNRLLHVGPLYSATGDAVAFTAGELMGKLQVHFNEHVEPVTLRLFSLTLSPDGRRYAYFGHGDAAYTRLVVDGVQLPAPTSALGGRVFFSPDSRHVVGALSRGWWCDDGPLEVEATPLDFTPDGRHLILEGREVTAERQKLRTFLLDGEVVARFATRAVQWTGVRVPQAWQQQDDGTIVFVGPTLQPTGALGPLHRVTVTPDPDRTVTTWLAQ